MKIILSTILTLIILIPIIILNKVSAESEESEEIEKTIIINEFMVNPLGDDAKYEWIEIKNVGVLPINLKGWKINNREIQEDLILNHFQIGLVVKNINEFSFRYGDFEKIAQLNFTLPNTAGTISLRNNENILVDEIAYKYSKEEISFERGALYESDECSVLYENPINHSVGVENITFDDYCWKNLITVDLLISTDNISFYPEIKVQDNQEIFFKYPKYENMDVQNQYLQNEYGNQFFTPFLTNELEGKNFSLYTYLDDDTKLIFFNLPIEFVEESQDNENNTEEEIDEEIEQIDYSGKLIFTEIFPSPKPNSEEREWIEIYSYTDNVSLENWYVTQKLNEDNKCIPTNKKLPKDSQIQKQGYFLIDQSNISFALKNAGDTIFLCDKNDNVVDSLIYPKIEHGISFSRSILSSSTYSDSFDFSTIPTPLEANKFINKSDETLEDEQEKKAETLIDTKVKVTSQSTKESTQKSFEIIKPASFNAQYLKYDKSIDNEIPSTDLFSKYPLWVVFIMIFFLLILIAIHYHIKPKQLLLEYYKAQNKITKIRENRYFPERR